MKQKFKISNNKKNDPIKGMSFDDWAAKLMPQWLKDAENAIETGDMEKANRLLDETFIKNELERLIGTEKVFSMFKIASLLKSAEIIARAEQMFEDLLKFNNHSSVYNELADIFKKTGRLNKAIHYLNTALEMSPNEPFLWGNLAGNLISLGQTEKAIELLRKVMKMRPEHDIAHSNYFIYSHYLQNFPRAEIFNDIVRWASRNMPPRLAKKQHRNIPDPNRRLKIGYISPDFRNHSVTYFFEPLLEAHNRDKFEIFGYGNVFHHDETTERLKSKFDQYRNVRPLDDKAKAELIESDGIDILVDLAGHSGNTGLYAMAYKPAPIQATWLGYPDTTGMSQIDYRITDAIADPPGCEQYYSEKLFYLPGIFLCYSPCGIQPLVAPAPFIEAKHITFGCFNNSSKINPLIIGLWAEILKQVPNSNLLLKFKSGQDDEIRDIFLKQFEQAGIAKDRIAISGWLQSPADLMLYDKVDIALDTFPYNGTTTTCQSLLMGVPLISLVGENHMSRVGLSIFKNLGMEFFAAPTPQQYVARAVALAMKPDSLAKIRNTMRDRLRASALCNKVVFAARMENAYRQMWQTWCQKQNDKKTVNAQSVAERL
ncbi:MAG: tetratricopeptide repeat protein [Planctomycetaceae bacterium]|nr:tetratricopeptide repeat protein [Planctomycetaceae bacterium]